MFFDIINLFPDIFDEDSKPGLVSLERVDIGLDCSSDFNEEVGVRFSRASKILISLTFRRPATSRKSRLLDIFFDIINLFGGRFD